MNFLISKREEYVEYLKRYYVKGKSTKVIREAFLKLKASFYSLNTHLEVVLRQREAANKKLYNARIRHRDVKERFAAARERYKLKTLELKKEHAREITQIKRDLNREIRKRDKHIERLMVWIKKLQARRNALYQKKYVYQRKIDRKQYLLRKQYKRVHMFRQTIKKLRARPPKIKVKTIRRTKYKIRYKKRPFPAKIKRLLLEGKVTRTRMDYLSIVALLQDFCYKTGLTSLQALILLEGVNHGYFTSTNMIHTQSTTLEALEDKGLIKGDRMGRTKAVGWYMTEHGKAVAEVLYKKLDTYPQFKKLYIKQQTKIKT